MRLGMIRRAGWRRGGPERWLAVAALLVSAAAAVGAVLVPQVTELDIVPSELLVDATYTATMELEARLRTGPPTALQSILPSSGLDIDWKVNPPQPWLTIVSQDSFRATLQIIPGTLSPSQAVVVAKVGGQEAESRIIPVTASDEDVLKASHTDGIPPVFVTRGIRDASGDACSVGYSAFVGTALLGKLVGECDPGAPTWGAAILDSTHAMALLPVRWKAGADTVDASPSQIPVRSIPVTVQIVIGGTGNLPVIRESARKFALDEIKGASSVLARNRVGVELSVVDTTIVTTSDARTTLADCVTGDSLTSDGDQPATLHVYYVNSMGGLRGLTCAGSADRPHRTVYVSWENRSSTTLLHELGHVLGLTLPGSGHSDLMAGFDFTNVLTGGENDKDPAGRHRLSIGQVFRMNADSGSWLNAAIGLNNSPIRETGALRLACQCGGTDPEGLCPRLAADLTSQGGTKSNYGNWDCHDLLRLPAMDDDQEPVALLAGLRWRSPRGACSVGASAQQADYPGTLYLEFDNFTRPGSCPAWAAVFFRKHRPLYRLLTEDTDLTWSDAAEEWEINPDLDALAADDLPPLPVSVQLHYPSSAKARVKADIAELVKVFGEDNRTGIELAFARHEGLACPSGTGSATIFVICYGPSSGPGNSASGPIHLPTGVSTPYGAAHLLGQAFGLPPLSPGESDPAFAGNVMHHAPGQRSSRLTLGQVFLINVALGWGPGTCIPEGACPPLATEVAP